MAITAEEFQALAAQGYNRIPICKEVLADLETPLSTYLKLADAPYTYLFESVLGGEKWGRYSIIGLPANTIVRVFGHDIQIEKNGHCIEQLHVADSLAWIEDYQQTFKAAELANHLAFQGGLVGYFGYDTVRYIEPRLGVCDKNDEFNCPDILLMLSEEVVVFDNLKGKLHIIVHVDPQQEDALHYGQLRIAQIEQMLKQPLVVEQTKIIPRPADYEPAMTSSIAYDAYKQAVLKAKQYMLDGDIMQVAYSRRLTGEYTASPMDLYRALRSINPSPYLYFLNVGDHHIVGSSPEILVRLQDEQVTVRPIAGTRKRGKTEAEDLALEKELLSDPKELAEHLMLIDLGRNDVGKVAQTESVKVTECMVVERYSHVMHIVSNVVGKIKSDVSAIDVLRATFPAGTVTGAPKIRAMEIIDELEPIKRGVYSGAVGYIGWNGNMDTAIAIRTAVIKDGKIAIQVGGGLVVDSKPEDEWEETVNKSRAVCKAVTLAERDLETLI